MIPFGLGLQHSNTHQHHDKIPPAMQPSVCICFMSAFISSDCSACTIGTEDSKPYASSVRIRPAIASTKFAS